MEKIVRFAENKRWISLAVLLVLIVSSIAFIVVGATQRDNPMIVFTGFIFGWAALIYGFVFHRRRVLLVKCLKQYPELRTPEYLQDIDLSNPVCQKAKLYFGEKSFYSKKSGVFLPCSSVAWTYLREVNSRGIFVGNIVEIFTHQGKAFSFKASNDEQYYYFRKIDEMNPSVLLGYSKGTVELYSSLCPEWGKKQKAGKIITYVIYGLLLLFVLLAMLIPWMRSHA